MFSGMEILRYNSPDFQASLCASTLTSGSTQSTSLASAPLSVQYTPPKAPGPPENPLSPPSTTCYALARGWLGFFGQRPPSSEPQTSFRPSSLNPAC